MSRSREKVGGGKLLGSLPFVNRTFEGHFEETPYVLDMDANLYVGPADHVARDHHAAVEVIFHFLSETGRIAFPLGVILRDRRRLLDAFAAFDRARVARDDTDKDFRILLHGTYDGVLLRGEQDDDLPAGPCGQAVNQVKLRFYGLCRRLDSEFKSRALGPEQREAERRLLASVFARVDP